MDEHHHHKHNCMSGRMKIGLFVFAAIAAFYLWTEHRAHLLGVAPFLIFLICPLMHLFMHGGHGDHGSKEGPSDADKGGKP